MSGKCTNPVNIYIYISAAQIVYIKKGKFLQQKKKNLVKTMYVYMYGMLREKSFFKSVDLLPSLLKIKQ